MGSFFCQVEQKSDDFDAPSQPEPFVNLLAVDAFKQLTMHLSASNTSDHSVRMHVWNLNKRQQTIRLNLMMWRLFGLLQSHRCNIFGITDRAGLTEIRQILQQLRDNGVTDEQMHDGDGHTMVDYLLDEQLENPWMADILSTYRTVFKPATLRVAVGDNQTPLDRLFNSEKILCKKSMVHFRDLVVRNNFFILLQAVVQNGLTSETAEKHIKRLVSGDAAPYRAQMKEHLGTSGFNLMVKILLGHCASLDAQVQRAVVAALQSTNEPVVGFVSKLRFYSICDPYNGYQRMRLFSSVTNVSIMPAMLTKHIALPIALTAFVLLTPGIISATAGIAGISIAAVWLAVGFAKYVQLMKGQTAERNLHRWVNQIEKSTLSNDFVVTGSEILPLDELSGQASSLIV